MDLSQNDGSSQNDSSSSVDIDLDLVVDVGVVVDIDGSYNIFSMFIIELLNSLILRFDDVGDFVDFVDVVVDGDEFLSLWKQIFSWTP